MVVGFVFEVQGDFFVLFGFDVVVDVVYGYVEFFVDELLCCGDCFVGWWFLFVCGVLWFCLFQMVGCFFLECYWIGCCLCVGFFGDVCIWECV